MTTTTNSSPAPSAPVLGGAFDELPGAPWRTPPEGNFSGFAIPAMKAMQHYASDEVGEATFTIEELVMTVRVVRTIEDITGRQVRVFHFIADEFEALMLFPEDMSEVHLSFRGSRAAFTEAVEVLHAAGEKARLKHLASAVH